MANIKKNQFSGGEIDPALHDNTDLKDWALGLSKAKNVHLGKNGRVINTQGTWFLKDFDTDSAKVVPVSQDDYVMVFWVSGGDIHCSAANLNNYVTFPELFVLPDFKHFGAIGYSVSELSKLRTKVVKEFDGTIWVYVGYKGKPVKKFRFQSPFIFSEDVNVENVPLSDAANYTVNNQSDLTALNPLFQYTFSSVYVLTDAVVANRGLYRRNGLGTWNQVSVNTIGDLTAGNYALSKATWDAITGGPVQYGITLVFDNGEESTINAIVTYRPGGSTNTAEYTSYTKLTDSTTSSIQYVFNNIFFTNNEYNGKLESAKIYRRPVSTSGSFGQTTGAGAWGFVGSASVSTSGAAEGTFVTVYYTEYGVQADFVNQPPYFSQDILDFYDSIAPARFHKLNVDNIQEYDSRLVYIKDDKALFSAVGFPNRLLRDFPIDSTNSFLLKVGVDKPVISGVIESNGLFIFTDKGVYGGVTEQTTQADPRIKFIGEWRSSDKVPPIKSPWGTFMLDTISNEVKRLAYSNEAREYTTQTVNGLADHLFKTKSVVSMAFINSLTPYAAFVMSDGTVNCMTFDEKNRVFGFTWKKHASGNYVDVVSHTTPNGNVIGVYSVQDGDKLYLEAESIRYVDYDTSYDNNNQVCFSHRSVTPSYITPQMIGELKRHDSEDWGNTLVIQSIWLNDTTDYYKAFSPDLKETCLLKFMGLTVDNYPLFLPVENPLPESMRGEDILIAPARLEVTGLERYEEKLVSVIADGSLVSSPFNPDYPALQVLDGKITLPEYGCHIIVGLPYVSDIQTLEIDTNSKGARIFDAKIVNKVRVKYDNTRGVYVAGELPDGDTVEGMDSAETWNYQDQINKPPDNKTIRKEYSLTSSWKENGQFALRQVDPLPFEVLSITLDVVAGG